MKQTAKKTKNKKQKTKKAATKAKQSDELRMGEAPRRNHKDSTFCLLFSEPKRAIELYNAITGENLPPDTELTYTTLENALYVDRNNDLGFVIQKRHFPAPEFYLFYVGTEKWSTKTLKLSDSFLAPPKENSIELVVNFINLNYNKDNEILQKSPSLLGYSKLLYYIKKESKENGGDLKKAIDASVKQCMDEGLIEDFLRKHSREVTGMLFNEITVEEFAEIRAREAYEDGEKAGYYEGEVAGAAQKQREIAKNFKQAGIPIEIIAENTGLSCEEVERL